MAEPTDPSESTTEGARRSPGRTFDSRATYVIRVEAQLSSDWSARLGGLRIATFAAGGVRVAELTGELRDQAALLGVLTELYELGLPLLAVVRTPEADRAAAEPARERRDGGLVRWFAVSRPP
jgi:hypothetical protein